MAVGMTKLTNVIVPEVFAAMVTNELARKIRFAPIATVDKTLVGQPGNKLNFPVWAYVGPATIIAEGAAIPLELMTSSKTSVTVAKAAKGIEISDEAMLSGFGDPVGQAVQQVALAIADKVDDDLITAALSATQTAIGVGTVGGMTVVGLQVALDKFLDEDDTPIVLLANPLDAAKLRMDAAKNYVLGSDVGANNLINGTYADILGVQVVRSNKVTAGAPILVKQGALALVMKRDVEVETDRDIIHKTTVITADEHYAAYLYDPTKIVKITTGTIV